MVEAGMPLFLWNSTNSILMKRYKIVHRTVYTFNGPVTLGPHYLMLRPRESHELRIEASVLQIDPAPTLRWVRDIEDNSIAIAEFSTPAERLEIYSEVDIQHYNVAPLDFIIDDYAVTYPFSYTKENRLFLRPYLIVPKHPTGRRFNVWLKAVKNGAEGQQTFQFLNNLMERIHNSFEYRVREEEGVQTAEDTLRLRTGSCRDFANLFIATARRCGFAARFVSGYLNTIGPSEIPGATHAWAEVYIPGGGWKGFDPTSNCVVGPDHITVAVSQNPAAVPPVAGSFIGPPGAQLQVGVWVKSLDEVVEAGGATAVA